MIDDDEGDEQHDSKVEEEKQQAKHEAVPVNSKPASLFWGGGLALPSKRGWGDAEDPAAPPCAGPTGPGFRQDLP